MPQAYMWSAPSPLHEICDVMNVGFRKEGESHYGDCIKAQLAFFGSGINFADHKYRAINTTTFRAAR